MSLSYIAILILFMFLLFLNSYILFYHISNFLLSINFILIFMLKYLHKANEILNQSYLKILSNVYQKFLLFILLINQKSWYNLYSQTHMQTTVLFSPLMLIQLNLAYLNPMNRICHLHLSLFRIFQVCLHQLCFFL